MPIAMRAIKVHTHYDPTGTILEVHHPDEIYELCDSNGLTADHMANVFTALGVALRTDVAPRELVGAGPAKRTKKA
jgi:hypothetical protein